jgi:hypothetical protein
VCVCVCVCMYVFVYRCVCVCMYMFVSVDVFVYVCVCLCVYICVYLHVNLFVCVYMYILCTFVCVYMVCVCVLCVHERVCACERERKREREREITWVRSFTLYHIHVKDSQTRNISGKKSTIYNEILEYPCFSQEENIVYLGPLYHLSSFFLTQSTLPTITKSHGLGGLNSRRNCPVLDIKCLRSM